MSNDKYERVCLVCGASLGTITDRPYCDVRPLCARCEAEPNPPVHPGWRQTAKPETETAA